MAKSNRNTVSDILEATRRGLGPFVLREYKQAYGAAFLEQMQDVLRTGAYAPKPFTDVKTAFTEIDLQGWLNLMMRRWHEVFKRTLGHAERSYVSELLEIRNNWAHQKPISTDDAYRAADTATRLLQAVNAVEAANFTQLQGRTLRRRQFAEEARTAERRTTHATDVPITTQKGLKPWRLVIQPQQDVARGRFEQAEFAADLAQVYRGDAEPEYNDPAEFFRRTYLTEGLVGLLANGLRRLNGLGGIR